MTESSSVKYKVEILVTNLSFPHGIAVQKGDGTIFVSDQNRNRIIRIVKQNEEYRVMEFRPINSNYSLDVDFPGGLIWDKDGRLLIADTSHTKIKVVDVIENEIVREIGPTFQKKNASGIYNLEQPRSMAFDKHGNLFVVNCGKQQIAKIDVNTGECIASAVMTLDCALPQGIAVDAENRIVYANRNKHTIHLMDSETLTEIGIIAGTGIEGHLDGPAHQARFKSPTGVAIDSQGNIYVTDNKAIRKIDRTSDYVSTILSDLDFPLCMVFDNQGNMLFTEYVGHAVKRVILNQRMPWKTQRILWIGHLKNHQTCQLSRLPKEIVKEIISFCDGLWE